MKTFNIKTGVLLFGCMVLIAILAGVGVYIFSNRQQKVEKKVEDIGIVYYLNNKIQMNKIIGDGANIIVLDTKNLLNSDEIIAYQYNKVRHSEVELKPSPNIQQDTSKRYPATKSYFNRGAEYVYLPSESVLQTLLDNEGQSDVSKEILTAGIDPEVLDLYIDLEATIANIDVLKSEFFKDFPDRNTCVLYGVLIKPKNDFIIETDILNQIMVDIYCDKDSYIAVDSYRNLNRTNYSITVFEKKELEDTKKLKLNEEYLELGNMFIYNNIEPYAPFGESRLLCTINYVKNKMVEISDRELRYELPYSTINCKWVADNNYQTTIIDLRTHNELLQTAIVFSFPALDNYEDLYAQNSELKTYESPYNFFLLKN